MGVDLFPIHYLSGNDCTDLIELHALLQLITRMPFKGLIIIAVIPQLAREVRYAVVFLVARDEYDTHLWEPTNLLVLEP